MPHERGIDATTTQFDVVIANVYAPNLKAEKKIFFGLMFENLNDFEGRQVVIMGKF